jgi:hypothetical protein
MNKEERLRLVNSLKERWQKKGILSAEKLAILDAFLAHETGPPMTMGQALQMFQKEGKKDTLTEEECEALVLEIMADDD